MFYKKAVRCAVCLSLIYLTGCTALASGRYYTLAKVNRQGEMIEAHRVIESSDNKDVLDKVIPNGNIAIKMNRGFVRYLEAVERPEVIMFIRATVQDPQKATPDQVWQKVYLSSEDKDAHIILNKNSLIPREDVFLLPPVAYSNQDILIELRIVELDKEDNQTALQFVNAAASVAAVWQPESAAVISAFQTALQFIVENNLDDIEFAYDIQISNNATTVVQRNNKNYDLALAPRVGTYALIKTEHIDRFNYPNSWFDATTSGARYFVAQVAKVATLGVFNWNALTYNPQEDFYLKIMGRPFGVDFESTTVPYFRDGELFVSRDYFYYQKGSYPGADEQQFFFEGNGLASAPSECCNIDESQASKALKTPYQDHSYLAFSIISPKLGLALEQLAQISGVEEDLKAIENIRTNQLSSKEIAESLGKVTNSLKAVVIHKKLLDKYRKSIENAKNPDEVAEYEAAYQKELAKVQELLTPETKAAIGAELREKSANKIKELGGFSLNPSYFYVNKNIDFTLSHKRKEHKESYSLYVHKENGDIVDNALREKSITHPANSRELNFVFVHLNPITEKGKYTLAFRNDNSSTQMRASFNVINEPRIAGIVNISATQKEIKGQNLNKEYISKVVLLDLNKKELSSEVIIDPVDENTIRITGLEDDVNKIEGVRLDMLHALESISWPVATTETSDSSSSQPQENGSSSSTQPDMVPVDGTDSSGSDSTSSDSTSSDSTSSDSTSSDSTSSDSTSSDDVDGH